MSNRIRHAITDHISQHLTYGEIACKCGCGFGLYDGDFSKSTVRAFEKIRERVGVPLRVNSGCRCKTHNAAVGGSLDSRHIHGDAMDIDTPDGWTDEAFYTVCDDVIGYAGGVGIYEGRVHIDTRGKYVRKTTKNGKWATV